MLTLQPHRSIRTAAPDETSAGTWGLLGLLTLLVVGLAATGADPSTRGVFVALVFAAAAVGVVIWRRGDVSTGQVLGFAVLFRLILFGLLPGLSDDAYRYVWDGLIQQEGLNPYRWRPDALEGYRGEPIYGALNSEAYYSVYPPVSQGIFAFGGLFYGSGWEASFYAIKGVLVALEVAGLLLLARMVKPGALLLYAWHPLVLVETAGQAHTEAAVIPFLIGALLLARRGKGGWASAAVAAAGWVKLYPFVLLPFLWRRFGLRAVWPAAAVTALLAVPYAHPDVPGNVLSSLRLYVRYFEFNAGPYYALKHALLVATGMDWSKLLGPLFGLAFVGALPFVYRRAERRRWPLRRAFAVTVGLFLLLATTVHPWYLLGVLPLVALAERPPWHWYWLALLSMGTYVFYTGGPYWPWVVAGWTGWSVLAGRRYRRELAPLARAAIDRLQRRRARGKARRVARMVPRPAGTPRVLDLGAAEGYVGDELGRAWGAEVTLADVVDMNRTARPHVRYDGRRLPFADDAFDVVVLYFVLHHCARPEDVLREAVRVTRGTVFVAESVYDGPLDRRLLRLLDTGANRLRGGEAMRGQEGHLAFRTDAAWRRLFDRLPVRLARAVRRGRWVHRQAYYVLVKE